MSSSRGAVIRTIGLAAVLVAVLLGCSDVEYPRSERSIHPFAMRDVRYSELFEHSPDVKLSLLIERFNKESFDFGVYKVRPLAKLKLKNVQATVALTKETLDENGKPASRARKRAAKKLDGATQELLRLADSLGPGRVVDGKANRVEIRYGDATEPTFVLSATEARFGTDGRVLEIRGGFELESFRGERVSGKRAVLIDGARTLRVKGKFNQRTAGGERQSSASRSLWLSSDGRLIDLD